MKIKNQKLQWKVKHSNSFEDEYDFLETMLIENGVEENQIKNFLHPTKKYINNPLLMKNMDSAIKLVHEHIKKKSRIFIKVDPDVDGFTSSAVLYQFLKEISPETEIDYKLNYEKQHGLTFKDLAKYTADHYGLIIVPDASIAMADMLDIRKNFKSDILVLDHHIIEEEYQDTLTGKWIPRQEAVSIYKEDKTRIIHDNYSNYCLTVNCMDGYYPNKSLSGVGVVQKFIEAYLDEYENVDVLNPDLRTYYYDLVSLGMNADSMDLQSLETRYYVLEGMKEHNCHNEFLNELVSRKSEDMKWGRYIISMSWQIAPLINGCIRYGKDEEQLDTFRAMIGVQELREYKPRRKSKDDPVPKTEIHSLQKTMARVCENVKSRQDTEVRKFMTELDEEIESKELDKNSVIFVDATKLLSKGTVSGLVANKLTNKYFRPVVLLRAKNSVEFGGSGRGYEQGSIENFNEFLMKAGVDCRGHENAFGVFLRKDKLDSVIEKCNELMPIENLCTIHTVDWEIPGSSLKNDYISEVANNYHIFGGPTVPEPLFAITNIKINAQDIFGYGEGNKFIRFKHNGNTYVKKYCSANDFDNMTLADRRGFGVNKKNLVLNIIGQFVLNSYEGQITPQVKILYFESTEDKDGTVKKESNKPTKKTIADDEWDW